MNIPIPQDCKHPGLKMNIINRLSSKQWTGLQGEAEATMLNQWLQHRVVKHREIMATVDVESQDVHYVQ